MSRIIYPVRAVAQRAWLSYRGVIFPKGLVVGIWALWESSAVFVGRWSVLHPAAAAAAREAQGVENTVLWRMNPAGEPFEVLGTMLCALITVVEGCTK